jgi:hypothetical protein
MDKIIGLGKMGCMVAEEFLEYPEYRVYQIGEQLQGRGTVSLGTYSTTDDYEKEPDFAEVEIYLRGISSSDEVLFIVSGSEPISGASLTVLEIIKDARISILYISPDPLVLSPIQARDNKIVFNVLQEYARSGLFEHIYLVDTPSVEEMIGDVSIAEYEKKIAHFIAYMMTTVNYFNHIDPIVSSNPDVPTGCRIGTLGFSSLEENPTLRNLFPFSQSRHLHFYYGIPESDLASDPTLMKSIKHHVKEFKNDHTTTGFSVYSTTFEETLVLCVHKSSHIQQLSS